jgi:hypothetical protein
MWRVLTLAIWTISIFAWASVLSLVFVPQGRWLLIGTTYDVMELTTARLACLTPILVVLLTVFIHKTKQAVNNRWIYVVPVLLSFALWLYLAVFVVYASSVD